MYDRAADDDVVQTTMPAAAYGPSPTVLTQEVRPMDPSASSCCSVPAAAVRKADGTWSAQRRFGRSTRRMQVLVGNQCGTWYSQEGKNKGQIPINIMLDA